MLKNISRMLLPFVAGLIVGLALAWLYWQQRIQEAEIYVNTLQTLLHEKARSLQKLKARQTESVAADAAESAAPDFSASARAVDFSAPADQSAPDDLTCIEGIGPKISQTLQAAGIVAFAQLAAADTERLTQILQEAKIRIADPSTWPEQAKLAAAGDWEALQALQAQLKGGRRA